MLDSNHESSNRDERSSSRDAEPALPPAVCITLSPEDAETIFRLLDASLSALFDGAEEERELGLRIGDEKEAVHLLRERWERCCAGLIHGTLALDDAWRLADDSSHFQRALTILFSREAKALWGIARQSDPAISESIADKCFEIYRSTEIHRLLQEALVCATDDFESRGELSETCGAMILEALTATYGLVSLDDDEADAEEIDEDDDDPISGLLVGWRPGGEDEDSFGEATEEPADTEIVDGILERLEQNEVTQRDLELLEEAEDDIREALRESCRTHLGDLERIMADSPGPGVEKISEHSKSLDHLVDLFDFVESGELDTLIEQSESNDAT